MTKEPLLNGPLRILGLLMISVLVVIAWLLYGYLANLSAVGDSVAGWKVVPGKIERITVESWEGAKPRRQAFGSYSYTYEGKSYRSDRIYHDVDVALAIREVRAFHSEIESAAKSGKPVDVHVNPLKPSESALYIAIPGSLGLPKYLGIGCGLVAVLLAIGLLYEFATSFGRARKPARS